MTHKQLLRKNSLSKLLPICWCLFLIQQHVAATVAADIDETYLKNIFKNLNTTADPCEDFYEFACGNWHTNYLSTKEYVDMPGYMEYITNQQLLATLLKQQNATEFYRKVWLYYKSCEKLEQPALNSYLRLVQKELNMEWPILRADWSRSWQNETNFDWLATIAKLRKYGLNCVFITQDINVRLTNGSHYLMQVHQHQRQQRLELKYDDVAKIFFNFGMTAEESELLIGGIMELEQQMLNLTFTDFILIHDEAEAEDIDLMYTKSYKEYTLKELNEKIPTIDWHKYIGLVLGQSAQIDINTVQTFNLRQDYFKALDELLHNTDNETLCYYIMLKFMYTLSADLPLADNRSLLCIKHLRGFMPLAMNYIYETHIFQPQRKTIVNILQSIYDKLRLNFAKLIDENRLNLTAAERNYITKELQTMHLKIGNVPKSMNIEFVTTYYANLQINASDFYANHLSALKHLTRQLQLKLQNRVINAAQHFYIHEPETASSSSPVKIFNNAILLPYGYLQLPFFHTDINPLLQYSLLGFMLAHEIIHAYDLVHIVYDMHSNYNALGVKVEQHFSEFLMCLEQEPNDIFSENMADVAGLRLVYQTYFDDVAGLSGDNALFNNSINFTAEQLFFINSVQFLCANMLSIDKMDARILNLEHEIHNKRVRENWAHFEGFSKAFKCANGTLMNPKQKCRLW